MSFLLNIAAILLVNFLLFARAAIGPRTTLQVSNKYIAPDGFNRTSVLVQGQYPAPLIRGNIGDRFRLNVVNNLTEDTMLRSTSIHWHGLFQRGTNWADGPVGVNQCPIAPGHSFLYEFSAPNQAGTYWYHSHFGTQYCDGLRGPFVVYDPNDPYRKLYDVDDDSTVITLGEWYHIQAPSITGPPTGDSTLINGMGRYVGGPKVDLAVINVKHGRRYRFRLVSISCDPSYVFSIDGHNMTIIEADGEYTQPHTVDSLKIFAGQRYSFILEANQKVDNYWVRALPNSGARNLSTTFVGGVNSAILRYAGAPVKDPSSTVVPEQKAKLVETDLHPRVHPRAPGKPFPGGADVNMELELGFDNVHFTVNGTSFLGTTDGVPVLLQILGGKVHAQDLLPKGSVYTLPRNKVIELTIPARAAAVGGPHPFHLHGHSFSVIRSADNNTANYINPIRRDVVSIGDVGSNVTIRFTTDNPGPWILHCHIDFHLDAGLAVVFAEDPKDVKLKNPTPVSWDQLSRLPLPPFAP